MKDAYRMRAAIDDIFDWSVINVRGLVDQNTWQEIRSHFSELKGILAEVTARSEKQGPDIDNTFDELEKYRDRQ